MTNGNDTITNLADNIFKGVQDVNFLGLSTAHLQNVAYYDFAEYQYILEPKVREFEEPTIDDLGISSADPTETLFLQRLRRRLEELIRQNSDHGFFSIEFRWRKVWIFRILVPVRVWNPVSIIEADRLDIIRRLIASLMDSESYLTLLELFRLALKVNEINEQEFIDWLPIIPENTKSATSNILLHLINI